MPTSDDPSGPDSVGSAPGGASLPGEPDGASEPDGPGDSDGSSMPDCDTSQHAVSEATAFESVAETPPAPSNGSSGSVYATEDSDGFSCPPVTQDEPQSVVREDTHLPPKDSDSDGRSTPRAASQTGSRDRPPVDDHPEFIGRFRVLKEIARGAFGVVFLARDEELERDVAIKLSLVTDPKYQERLRVEATKVAKVESPGIVPVYHIGKTDANAVFIVQKFIEGETLRDALKGRKKFTALQATQLLLELAVGLGPAHQHDILHRDLKPDNILLDGTGKAWIADFGLAISEEEQQGRREFAGTPPYMSPEQVQGRVDFLDARSDLWSLGVIYYEMLSGRLPFRGGSLKAMKEQICERDPKPLQQYVSGMLTDEIDQVFRRCCAKQPSERFATVDQLAEELRYLIPELAEVEELGESGLGTDHGTADHRTERGSTRRLAGSASRHGSFRRGSTRHGSTHLDSARHDSTRTASTLSSSALASATTVWQTANPWVGRVLSATAIAIVVAGAFLAREFMSPDGGPDPTPSVPEVVSGDFDGSLASPWVVSKDGKGSHRSIQAAVDWASEGHMIQLNDGIYNESVVIRKAIQLRGNPEIREQYSILGRSGTALSIECEGGVVIVKGCTIEGRGGRKDAFGKLITEEFNAIELRSGTLQLDQCDVGSLSYNGVKVKRGASLVAKDCNFVQSGQNNFAISGKDHADVVVRGCSFETSGIQLVGGLGQIASSRFSGPEGVQVQESPNGVGSLDSSDRSVTISDCTFEGNSEFGVLANVGGRIDCHDNDYRGCAVGAWVGQSEEGVDDLSSSEQLVLSRETFENCEIGVNVGGGQVLLQEGCSILGGTTGIGCSLGTLKLTDLTISDCSEKGVHSAGGTIDLRGLTIRDCRFAIMLDSETRGGTIDGLDVSKCSYGVYFKPQEKEDERLTELTIRRGKFSHCDYVLVSLGQAITKFKACSFTDIKETRMNCLEGAVWKEEE